jgi:hypothetical protein
MPKWQEDVKKERKQLFSIFYGLSKDAVADSSGRAVKGLRPFVCWDCGFESLQVHGCLCLVTVVCYQLEVFASG